MRFLPWDIRVVSPRGNQAATESRYPTYGAYWVFQSFHNPPISDMGYSTFNIHTDFHARKVCKRGCMDTVRESALNVDSGRKIPCRTGESNLCHRRAGPTLYHLSLISIPKRVHLSFHSLPPPLSLSLVREVRAHVNRGTRCKEPTGNPSRSSLLTKLGLKFEYIKSTGCVIF